MIIRIESDSVELLSLQMKVDGDIRCLCLEKAPKANKLINAATTVGEVEEEEE